MLVLEAGAVFLPCDDVGLSAMAARSDVCSCTDSYICDVASGQRCQGQKRWRGELLARFLDFRNAQQLVLAHQRLSFASAFHIRLGAGEGWHLRSGGGTRSSASSEVVDFDVVNLVGELLLTAPNLRPGWLGREAVAALAA